MRMINRKKPALALITFLMVFLIAGCAGDGGSVEGEGAFSTTDMKGRTVDLTGAAEKIVVLTAADCEILYAIGGGDILIGRGAYCDYPAAALDVPVVQSGSDTNIEQILALRPEVVIMSTMDQSDEQIAALENAGIKVVVTDAQDIQGVYEAIHLIGQVTGKNQEAEGLIHEMKTAFENMKEKVGSPQEKTIYFEVSPLEYGLWTAGSGTFMEEISEMLGVKNLFSDVNAWGEISQEQVIDRNPDYIVSVTMYFGEGPLPEEEIKGRLGWQNISAVKNDGVIHADSDEITRPGPRLVDAAENLYSFIYEN